MSDHPAHVPVSLLAAANPNTIRNITHRAAPTIAGHSGTLED